MSVTIQVRVRAVTVHLGRLRRLVKAVLRVVGEESSDVGVVFLNDKSMRRLNRRYRRNDRPTDVLAFAMREARVPHGSRLAANTLGDVVISVSTAIRQARENRHQIDEEITRLLVHGILHLCGYDHERSPAEARRMRRRERSVIRMLGAVPRLVHVKRTR